jgi:hypothetical protein
MSCYDAATLPAKVQNALYNLFWIEHFVTTPDTDQDRSQATLLMELRRPIGQLVWYTASGLSTQQQRVTFLDKFLSDIRLQLLPLRSEIFSREKREHVPGDIFSHWMPNGRRQSLDEGESHNLRSSANLDTVIWCEAEFWRDCKLHRCLQIYPRDRMHALEPI